MGYGVSVDWVGARGVDVLHGRELGGDGMSW